MRRKVQKERTHGWKPGGSLAGTFFPLCALNALKVMEPCLAQGGCGCSGGGAASAPSAPLTPGVTVGSRGPTCDLLCLPAWRLWPSGQLAGLPRSPFPSPDKASPCCDPLPSYRVRMTVSAGTASFQRDKSNVKLAFLPSALGSDLRAIRQTRGGNGNSIFAKSERPETWNHV